MTSNDDDKIAIDVEEGVVDDASADHRQHVNEQSSSSQSINNNNNNNKHRRRNVVIVASIACAAVALGLGLGLGLSGNNGSSTNGSVSSGGSASGEDSDAAVSIPAGSDTIEEEEESASTPPVVINTDEDDVQVGRNQNVTTEEEEDNDEEGREPADVEPQHANNNNENTQQHQVGKNDDTTSSTPTPPPITPRYFKKSPTDPIQTQLLTINPSIMDGYSAGDDGCSDLYQDIVNATLIVANERIKQVAKSFDRYDQQKWPGGGGAVGGGPVFADGDGFGAVESVASVAAPEAPQASVAADVDSGSGGGGGSTIQEDSFGSNNQETGVDEADIVKSDGTHVFMAYGDILVVTDAATGEVMSRTTMPLRKNVGLDYGNDPYPGIGPILTPVAVEELSETPDEEEGKTAVSPNEEDVAQQAKNDDGRRRDSLWIPPNPKPTISSLLLDPASNRLAVIVSGYRENYPYDYADRPILRDRGDVHVRLYDTSAMPTDGKPLSLITSREMWGSYRSARMIQGMAHVTVQSSVNWYQHISRYFDRWQVTYDGMNKTQYLEAAAQQATTVADKFAKRLIDELKQLSGTEGVDAGDCSGATRVAMFASDEGGDAEDGDADEDGTERGWPDALSSGGVLNSYLQVNTFDMNLAPNWNAVDFSEGSPPLVMKTAGSFFPSSWSEIYASEDVIVASGRGYNRRPFARTWDESTYLLTFELNADGSAPSGRAIGRVPGYVLNQFSLDEHKGYLRVATTTNAKWGCLDQTMKEEAEDDGADVSRQPCKWGRITDSTSQVTIMKLPDASDAAREMEPVGVVDNLGVTEVIMSARFFNDKAYVVTFERTDPLYTLDLSDPENPKLTDELKISGFSSYLHPVGDDRLLAIGREANEETGRVTGFQITLFDVADLTNTRVVQRYTIEDQWSSSLAERDHLAFRYLPLSKLLLIPLSIHGSGDKREPFDGFSVYYVDDETIEPRFSVSMVEEPNAIRYGCWYDAYMSARTLVFKGDATFIKGHSLVSYDLGSQEQRWYHNLDEDRTEKDRCYYYWR